MGSTVVVDLTSLAGGATTLTFIDWPSTIGIDNLSISGCVSGSGRFDGAKPYCDRPASADTPLLEPASLALLRAGPRVLIGACGPRHSRLPP